MYKDLLKISRTKKQIKTIKESKFPDPEAFQRWLNTRCNNVKKKKPPGLQLICFVNLHIVFAYCIMQLSLILLWK